jgi:hypothetical protein
MQFNWHFKWFSKENKGYVTVDDFDDDGKPKDRFLNRIIVRLTNGFIKANKKSLSNTVDQVNELGKKYRSQMDELISSLHDLTNEFGYSGFNELTHDNPKYFDENPTELYNIVLVNCIDKEFWESRPDLWNDYQKYISDYPDVLEKGKREWFELFGKEMPEH